jgi:hypothetical protein
MKQNIKHLASMALCCLPMIVVPLLLGIAGTLGWRTGAFGVVLTALAVLACPVSMGLMMWQMSRHSSAQAHGATPTTRAVRMATPATPEPDVAPLNTKTS